MNLTNKERAAMVEDLKELAKKNRMLSVAMPTYDLISYGNKTRGYYERMALNYEALAEALAERKPFEAVA